MAGEQTRLIREHLLRRFMLDGILPAQAQEEQDKLDTFDSFHDFRNGTGRGRKDCCTPELNVLTNSDAQGYLKFFGVPPSQVEEKTVDLYEKTCPLAVGFSLNKGINFVDVVSFNQILANPACLANNKSPAVKIVADADLDTVEKEKTIANALFTYLYGVPTEPTGVFFTFDASTNITKNFILNMNDAINKGFFVGQLLTPQNITDSATSPSSAGLFKKKVFNKNVPMIGEAQPPNKDRTKYVCTFKEFTSNYFSRSYTKFRIEPNTAQGSFTSATPYNFTYSITLPDKNGTDQTVVINFATTPDGKIGKDGPSVDYLKKVIKKGVPLPLEEGENGAEIVPIETINRCATIEALIDFVEAEYGEEAARKLIECIFDIKRAGDHEQSNALFYFLSIAENIHKGILQTLDQLSALYSRLLGNTTIYTYNTRTEKNLLCYKGTRIVDPLQLKQTILASLMNNINRILGVYLYFTRVIENSGFTKLLQNLQLYTQYSHPTNIFFEYLVKIRAADAYLYLNNIKTITYGGGGGNVAEIAVKMRQKLTQIYNAFGRELPAPEAINIHINIDTLNEVETQRYIDLIMPFMEEINNNLKAVQKYTEKFQENNIIFDENGAATSLDIIDKMFTIKKDRSIDVAVSNKSLNFSRQSAFNVVNKFKPDSEQLRADVESELIKYLNKAMLIDKYYSTDASNDILKRIGEQYDSDPELYKVRILENVLVPFYQHQVQLIGAQGGGGKDRVKNDTRTFYNVLYKTLSFVSKILVTKDNLSHLFLTTTSDIKSNTLIRTFHEGELALVSEYKNNVNISDTLLKMHGIIMGYSTKKYYSEEDIKKLGGQIWIAQTFIELANEFEDMYVNLEFNYLPKSSAIIIKKFYKYVFSPFIKKYNRMYKVLSNDYKINTKLFSTKDLVKLKVTLEVFGTELPRGLDYDPKKISKVLNHLIDEFKHKGSSLAHKISLGQSLKQSKKSMNMGTQKKIDYNARHIINAWQPTQNKKLQNTISKKIRTAARNTIRHEITA
jgi:hypothetical protein